jgi:hypothetical protein
MRRTVLRVIRGCRAQLVVGAAVAALCASGGMASAAAADTPSFSVNDIEFVEGTGAAPTTATFTVTLDGEIPAGGASVKYRTSTLTATDGVDYTPIIDPQTLNFPQDGLTTRSLPVSVPITADATDEYDETFQLVLTNPAIASGSVVIAPDGALGLAQIDDDDAPPSISIADAQRVEGTGTATQMLLTVSLSAISGKTIRVDWATTPGTAQPEVDYLPPDPPTQTSTFVPGVVSQQLIVTLTADAVDEFDETFGVTLSNPRNFNPSGPIVGDAPTLARAVATATIQDDDGPTISVGDATVTEGGAGTSQVASVVVTLATASLHDVGFSYATADDSATAPADYDAVTTPQTVVIPAGSTTATIPITVRGDDLDEADETVKINLTAPVHGSITRATGTLTITDSSPTPAFTVGDVSIGEGTGGTKAVTLTAHLQPASGRPISIRYTTRDGNAVAGVDYQQSSDVLAFAPGETTKTFTIAIATDDAIEEDETFSVDFAYTAGDGPPLPSATVTILDDDLNAGNTPGLSISDASVREGDTGTRDAVFTLTLAEPLTRTVTVQYATANGTAKAPGDYTARTGTVSFPVGTVKQTILIAVRGDRVREPNEDFDVVLSHVQNAKLTTTKGQGVITDDDAGLTASSVATRTAAAKTFLCRRGAACPGLLVRWRTAARGTIRVALSSLLPASPGSVKSRATKKAKPAKRIRLQLLSRVFTVDKLGAGQARVRLRPGRVATKLLQRLRQAKANALTVSVTFTNRTGAAQTQTFELKLRL